LRIFMHSQMTVFHTGVFCASAGEFLSAWMAPSMLLASNSSLSRPTSTFGLSGYSAAPSAFRGATPSRGGLALDAALVLLLASLLPPSAALGPADADLPEPYLLMVLLLAAALGLPALASLATLGAFRPVGERPLRTGARRDVDAAPTTADVCSARGPMSASRLVAAARSILILCGGRLLATRPREERARPVIDILEECRADE
jgi:hypothetical protein